MRFALMTEPQQGYSYQDILDTALAAERLGFETFFRSDHYSSFPGQDDLPTTDAWTTLAGLARETTRIASAARGPAASWSSHQTTWLWSDSQTISARSMTRTGWRVSCAAPVKARLHCWQAETIVSASMSTACLTRSLATSIVVS